MTILYSRSPLQTENTVISLVDCCVASQLIQQRHSQKQRCRMWLFVFVLFLAFVFISYCFLLRFIYLIFNFQSLGIHSLTAIATAT